MYWGFSEAINLLESFHKHMDLNKEKNEINILLLGSGDPRHIIKTLSDSFNYPNVKLNFYMVEGISEIIARNLLLTIVALESNKTFSLTSKTNLFMDIYGNALTRPITHNYICSRANNLIKMITDEDYAAENYPFIKYDLLKYRERDGLENIFQFWLNKKENIFNASLYWENRLRALLKTRFDHRNGAFDWDLMMRLKDRGAQQICNQEYTYWRETGIAFTFPEFEYNAANKTFASGLVKTGNTYKHRGYLGDMTVGPFASFGLHCSDTKMLVSDHGRNQYRATDVTFRNLYEIFYKINERKSYIHDGTYSPAYGAATLQQSKIYQDKEITDINIQEYKEPLLNFSNFSLHLVSMDDIMKIGDCKHFQNMFDIAFVAQNYFSFVKDSFVNVLADECLVHFETRQISLHAKEDVAKFLEDIKLYAGQNKMECITKISVINKPYESICYKYLKYT